MTNLRLILRKMRAHIPQLAGLVLLLMVGVCFFITLFTIVWRYEETAEQFFEEYAYADATFYGAFGEESVQTLSAQQGVTRSEGRVVRDIREGDRVYRAISLTTGINTPYLYEGRMPTTAFECLLLRRNAEAMGFSVGDSIALEGRNITITGLCASPEYVYLVQNERTLMAEPGSFAVLYGTSGFFFGDEGLNASSPVVYNELVAMTGDGFSLEDASKAVGAFQAVTQADQPNHVLYRSDLEEISSFAAIFPFIFAVLIVMVIYVMLSRSIQKDRRQIGTMKALGMPDGRIIRIYLAQYCLAALLGSLLGCFLAVLISDGIIGIFAAMFEVPALRFVFYPALWGGALFAAVAICAVSGLISLLSILPLLPANAMRPRLGKGGKRLRKAKTSKSAGAEQGNFLWRRLSFNTRYALQNTLRNKGRFFAVVLGMCGSCALLVFSLGFENSIRHTQDEYFDNFANYDVIVSFDPIPLDIPSPTAQQVDSEYKALVLPVEIDGETYPLAVVEKGFDMVKLPAGELQNGVILPAYFAGEWNIGVGDTLRINAYTAKVSAVVPQYLGLTLYTSYDYLNSAGNDLPPVYNSVYARSSDMAGLTRFLKGNNIDFSTIEDDNGSFKSIMESMTVLIWFMIACAVVLGFTVLYAVGLINLSAREYEYMFMGVMGYRHKSILAAHAKETLVQLILAIPLGFLAGNLLLESVKGEFSGANFAIATDVFPQSYLFSALAIVGVTLVMVLVTSKHIAGLDIVEGLKARDE